MNLLNGEIRKLEEIISSRNNELEIMSKEKQQQRNNYETDVLKSKAEL